MVSGIYTGTHNCITHGASSGIWNTPKRGRLCVKKAEGIGTVLQCVVLLLLLFLSMPFALIAEAIELFVE